MDIWPAQIGRASCRERVEMPVVDGTRDYKVTGVQTCALPIWLGAVHEERPPVLLIQLRRQETDPGGAGGAATGRTRSTGAVRLRRRRPRERRLGADVRRWTFGRRRSEERRVGKEWRCRS